jgi:type II secretory pathway pseudopilin PulG
MNDENQSYESPVSCVWPLATVLGALLLVNLVQLVSIVKERQAVSQTTGQAAQAIARYKTVSDKLENLAKDLMRLSLTNNEAKEIVTQFNIQMNQPGGAVAAPAKK